MLHDRPLASGIIALASAEIPPGQKGHGSAAALASSGQQNSCVIDSPKHISDSLSNALLSVTARSHVMGSPLSPPILKSRPSTAVTPFGQIEQGFVSWTSSGQQKAAKPLVISHVSEFASKNITDSTASEQRVSPSSSSPGITAPSETPPGQIAQGFASSGQHDCCTIVRVNMHKSLSSSREETWASCTAHVNAYSSSSSSPGYRTSALSFAAPLGQGVQGFVTSMDSPNQLPLEASAGQHA
mmetsp:Transcript_27214/g.64634  ORF Transcript_27214/g.64634 Transcript_27214/m.64634 type:complete len:242 (+) Transcript_27214:554-1279(+)